MSESDELVCQFMAFSGCSDAERAQSYLEMSGNNLEMAISLYMDHSSGGGAADADGDAGVAPGLSEIRAPDATQRMQLMDVGLSGYGMHLADPEPEPMNIPNAFAIDTDIRAAINAAVMGEHSNDDGEDDDDDEEYIQVIGRPVGTTGLQTMFSPPTHLMYTAGGFQGARSAAKDARRWLLVNIQSDAEFSSHALNRDVWRDDLVENLVREGFIFWQTYDVTPDGRTYAQRYDVHDYPHVGIIDPRTGRLLWRKEGWTQEKPMTAETFAEMAMDFCSRHSFDKEPQAPRAASASINNGERKRPFMTEQEQIQAAMVASLKKDTITDVATDNGDGDNEYCMEADDDDEEIECLGTEEEMKQVAEPAFIEKLLDVTVPAEPSDSVARVQVRMPDGKRLVRKFANTDKLLIIYAFVAVSAFNYYSHWC